MCVHFPLCQVLNSIIATLPNYEIVTFKLLYGIIEYAVVFLFSLAMVYLCNRFIPTLSGGMNMKCA